MHRALPIALLAISCVRNVPTAQTQSMAPSGNVYLRNTFDTDPSLYLGRFVPAGLSDLDESAAMQLVCSKHISYRFIDGGGVAYSENLNVSSEVGAKLGIPVVASAGVDRQASRTARVEYKLTGKMVAEIRDPEAFAACCKDSPDQCSDRYIGEFIQGVGALYHEASQSTDVRASATVPQYATTGSASVGSDSAWKRAAEFESPVYFAFKVTPTPYSQGTVSTCPDWVNNPPRSDQGVYVVGSGDAKAEESARNQALNDATRLSVRAAGLETEASYGVLPGVRAESFCVEPSPEKEGRYSARVLAFLSNEAISDARARGALAAKAAAEAQAAAALAAKAAAESQPAPAPAPAPVQAPPVELPALVAPPAVTPPAPAPVAPPAEPAAAKSGYEKILAAIDAESFPSDKLSALAATAKVPLTCEQARAILDRFAHSSDKLEALKLVRMRVSDRDNWQTIVEGFTFSGDREVARSMLEKMEAREAAQP